VFVADGKNKGLLHKLDKKTRDRHFPEHNGGKGDHNRTSTKESRKLYRSNHETIDWSYTGKSFIKSGN